MKSLVMLGALVAGLCSVSIAFGNGTMSPSASLGNAQQVLNSGAGQTYDGSLSRTVSSVDAGLMVSDIYTRSSGKLKNQIDAPSVKSLRKFEVPALGNSKKPSKKDEEPLRPIDHFVHAAGIAVGLGLAATFIAVVTPVLFIGLIIGFMAYGLAVLVAPKAVSKLTTAIGSIFKKKTS